MTSKRQAVRKIASRLKKASYGKKMNVNAAWVKRLTVKWKVEMRCCRKSTSFGFRNISKTDETKDGIKKIPIMN